MPPARQQSQRRRRVGRAAADAGGNGEALVEGKAGAGLDAVAVAQSTGGAQDQIVALARKVGSKGANDLQSQILRRGDVEPVAVLGKGEDGLDPVIGVGPALADVQGEVDLGVERSRACLEV